MSRTWLVGAMILGCSGIVGGSREPGPPPEPELRTDLEGLRSLVALPSSATTARWYSEPLGVGGWAPGPTDFRVIAYVTLDDPGELDALYGAPLPGDRPLHVRAATARVLDEEARSSLSVEPDGSVWLEGARRSPERTGGLQIGSVYEIGTGGMFLQASSM